MEKVIMGTRLPAKLWLDEVEDSCMSQIMDLTSLPFAFKHIVIMPDAHAGKGMPIGGVLATNSVIGRQLCLRRQHSPREKHHHKKQYDPDLTIQFWILYSLRRDSL